MKLSIIVPIYNCASSLKCSIGSLLSCENEGLEVVAVNDGSTDNSLEILLELAERDSRLHIINKDNGGVSSARNAGIEACSGDYIGFLDADDYYCPDAIARIFDSLIQLENVDVLLFGFIENYSDGRCSKTKLPANPPKCGKEVLARYYELGANNLFGSACLTCVSRELIDRLSLRFDTRISLYEDLLFVSQIMRASQRFRYIDEPLYVYRKPERLHYESFRSQECYSIVYRYLCRESGLPVELIESNCVYSVTRDLYHCIFIDRNYIRFKQLLEISMERYSAELGKTKQLKKYLPKKIYYAARLFLFWGRCLGFVKETSFYECK